MFVCSDSFLRDVILRGAAGFSKRRPTRAAQKVPANAAQIGDDYFLRNAYVTDRKYIPPELTVNSDQTQSPYAHGESATWSESGAKQVSVIGQEEKRAFTLNVGISMSGELLPFQAIYQGMTRRSLPKPDARGQDRAAEIGILFEPSMTKTYWSTQATMRSYVDNILVPYYERQCALLGLGDDQEFLWVIDCWSVHRSKEFRTWMKVNHPRITMLYVPANCTSI
ncbi:hypothetical protein AURDEDRAFT_49858, partial [Auricularia subglabra TFB-10046 SS5]